VTTADLNGNQTMKSIFITGASGFLGLHLISRLDVEQFSRITLLSRSVLTLPEHLQSASNVKIINASLEQTDAYASYLDDTTIVLHLAAVTGKASSDEYRKVNTHGTEKLVKVAASASVTGFVFISSIAVAFKNREGYVYAQSKQDAELAVQNSNLNYCIVRPTIILGKASPIWHSFSKLAQSSVIVLPGTGQFKIQPIEVDDLSNFLLDVIHKNFFNNEVIEVGGPDVLTIEQFVCKIHRIQHSKNPKVIHLPISIIIFLLRQFEKLFPALLPVNSGQFSSFCNDGYAKQHQLTANNEKMSGIDVVIKQLSETDNHG